MDKEFYMREALSIAKFGMDMDEVPVGAIIVRDGEIIARGCNHKISRNCAVFHAEIVATIEANSVLDSWYLDECDIYVTLEPCPMCMGAIINTRFRALYFGAHDIKAGCCGSVYDFVGDKKLNHRMKVEGGILETECGLLLTEYFKKKRREKTTDKEVDMPMNIAKSEPKVKVSR